MIKRLSTHKGFKPRTKPMNKIGKQGKKNAAANRETKKQFIKKDIRHCQLCGRGTAMSNSHSQNRDYKPDLTRSALLCIWPCHQFLELECNHEEREAVND